MKNKDAFINVVSLMFHKTRIRLTGKEKRKMKKWIAVKNRFRNEENQIPATPYMFVQFVNRDGVARVQTPKIGDCAFCQDVKDLTCIQAY